MAYTNSSLVSYTRISPNRKSPRNHTIDTITIHCVVGQCSVEALGAHFASASLQASSNYGIGYDGRIGMYVEEKDRSLCSSNGANDNRAITIEVASDTFHPYAVTDAAYESLIKLVADICKRNNIKELKWKGDRSLIGQVDKQNMTVHRWFAAKACPGDYLYSRHGDIARRVNKLLGITEDDKTETSTPVKSKFEIGDEVSLVAGARYTSGKAIPSWLFNSTLYVRNINDGGDIVFSTLKTGAITGITSPEYLIKKTKPVTNNPVVNKPVKTKFSVGDVVKLTSNAKYISGKSIAPFLFNVKLYVRAINGNNITVSTLKTGAITGIVDAKYLVGYNSKEAKFTPYNVKIDTDSLNIRKGAGVNYDIRGAIKNRGVYTIVEEATGDGASKWGLLKAYQARRNGWISLDYVKRI